MDGMLNEMSPQEWYEWRRAEDSGLLDWHTYLMGSQLAALLELIFASLAKGYTPLKAKDYLPEALRHFVTDKSKPSLRTQLDSLKARYRR